MRHKEKLLGSVIKRWYNRKAVQMNEDCGSDPRSARAEDSTLSHRGVVFCLWYNTTMRNIRNIRKNAKRLKIRKAVWQFIVDHMKVAQTGQKYANFIIEDESNFWERVAARENGYSTKEYSAINKTSMIRTEQLVEESRKLKLTIDYQNKLNLKKTKKFEAKEKGGLFDRMIVRIYKKTRDYIFK